MILDLRLSELIARAVKQAGNYLALQAEIAKETGDEDFTVDRRKLKKLCTGNAAATKLTIRELRALQIFFSSRGLIDPRDNMIFSRPKSLLDGFANESSIEILLITRYSEEANVELSSRWDLRASLSLQQAREFSNRVKVNLHDVFHYGREIRGRRLMELIENEEWYRLLDDNRALISIGSPFGSYSTECLLCAMVGLDRPFEPVLESQNLPFRFYWGKDKSVQGSAFEMTGIPADTADADHAACGPVDRGLVVGDRWYPAWKNGESTNLVLAQYRNGRLRIALCGIYAPATLGLAELLADIPLLIRENRNHILVATVRSTIDAAAGGRYNSGAEIRRDPRSVSRIEFDTARIWDPDTRNWEES